VAKFIPATFPEPLATRPALRGERRVWEALRRAPLPADVTTFYNRAPEGCRRRTDFLIVDPARGLLAIEVKGGLVQYRDRDGFRQWLPNQRWPKKIEPWMQAGRALQQTLAALHLNQIVIPCAPVLAVPHRRRDQFPFELPPRMLTAEDLRPAALVRKLDTLLPRLDRATEDRLAPIFETILAALSRPSDHEVHKTNEPVLIAYAVRDRPGGKRHWLRIGVAFRQGG
jgi:hypothetical protein